MEVSLKLFFHVILVEKNSLQSCLPVLVFLTSSFKVKGNTTRWPLLTGTYNLDTYIGGQLPDFNNSVVLLHRGFFYSSIIVYEESRWRILKGGRFPVTFETEATDVRCPEEASVFTYLDQDGDLRVLEAGCSPLLLQKPTVIPWRSTVLPYEPTDWWSFLSETLWIALVIIVCIGVLIIVLLLSLCFLCFYCCMRMLDKSQKIVEIQNPPSTHNPPVYYEK